MNDVGNVIRPGAVAVIGLSGRFPGARNSAQLWTDVRESVEAITFFTDEQLLAAGVPPEAVNDPAYVKACGRLSDIDMFDAAFFGMSPRDAAVFDPRHRFFLECAWEAFEDAGYVGEQFEGPVGVYASSGAPEYFMHNLLRNGQTMESVGARLVRHNGNDSNFLATRVSYELNLNGPSMIVQAACSSSLLAVHLACQSLATGEYDMALAGGSTIYVEQDHGYFYKQGQILSPDGHCRAFDAKAAGTVMANAVGCVVLRRLDDAIRDGDRILAIIRGSANNDCSQKVGYLAPSVSGQTRVVTEALLRELYLWRNFERAQAQYRQRSWKGSAILFRGEQLNPAFHGGGLTYGWNRHVLSGIHVVTVPGDHSRLLLGTNAELLVRSPSEAIDRVSRTRPELAGTARSRVGEAG